VYCHLTLDVIACGGIYRDLGDLVLG